MEITVKNYQKMGAPIIGDSRDKFQYSAAINYLSDKLWRKLLLPGTSP